MDAVEFGRYQLLGLIGEGGVGQVFRARDAETGQDVAIKVLPTELAGQPGYRERFRREAHTWAQLTGPHIIRIFDSGEIDGHLFLVMPITDGIDVASLLDRDGPMSPQRAVRVIEQLASALDAAHAQGLVHGDVKPSNALITETAGRDFVYLTECGIAHDAGSMAPNGGPSARADIYALACVLHECLTGNQPFAGYSTEQQIAGQVAGDPPRPSEQRSGIPTGFDDVIARGTARNPDGCYQSARDLAAAAKRALTEPAPSLVDDTDRPGQAAPVEVPTQAGAPEQPTIDEGTNHPLATTDIPALPSAQPAPSRSRRTLAIAGAAAVVIVAILAVIGYLVFWPTSSGETASKKTGLPTAPAPPRQVVLPFTVLDPDEVAVDNTGAVYVADSGNNRVLKLPVGSNTPTALPFTGLNKPAGLAVDNDNSIYVGDQYNNRVLKLPAGSNTPTELPFTGLREPNGVEVDRIGNVYVADFRSNRVLKLPAGSDTQTELPFTGLNGPFGVAVDDAGTVYVTDSGNNRVVKLAAGENTPVDLPFAGLNYPDGVAVDRSGSVYVSDLNNNRVLKLAAGSNTPSRLPFIELNFPYGVTVDNQGNVYVADFHNRVVKLPPR